MIDRYRYNALFTRPTRAASWIQAQTAIHARSLDDDDDEKEEEHEEDGGGGSDGALLLHGPYCTPTRLHQRRAEALHIAPRPRRTASYRIAVDQRH